jgi:hypothetical protein
VAPDEPPAPGLPRPPAAPTDRLHEPRALLWLEWPQHDASDIETRLARLEDKVDRLLALQSGGADPGVARSDALGGPPAGDVR